MDEIRDFFDFSKDFVRTPLPRGMISGAAMAVPSNERKQTKREFQGTDYVADAVAAEKRVFEEKTSKDVITSNVSCMDDLENFYDDFYDDDVPKAHADRGIYAKYNFDLNRDDSLPIHDFKDEIVSKIRSNPVVIFEGDTGCGKSTQVPQYIIDDAYRRGEYCKIVCTQPRRIAAMSVSQRVAEERQWPLGSVVAFQVGLHTNVSADTHILYCTTGVLLQKLVKEKSMNFYTHIILDEVHERDQDMDFLLIIIRRLLGTNSKKVKIILMSATINTVEFADYFKINRQPAPVLRVDLRRRYTVHDFYLDDLKLINRHNIEVLSDKAEIKDEMYNIAFKLIAMLNMNESKAGEYDGTKSRASILVFLPGINEINEMYYRMQQLNTVDIGEVKIWAIRLHSLIPPDEQSKIFYHTKNSYRKVILATNIAESSITVPDVKYVIDFCLMKSLFTDTATNFTSLQLHWVSKANCKQRAGRAGRAMNGYVYRMVSKKFYEGLDDFGVPEMLRSPMENVILKAKLLDMGSPPQLLGLALSPPNLSDIYNTILMLKEIGALYKHVDEVYKIDDGDLTFMGRIMAILPIDIRLTRLIMLGYMFSTLEESIIMAAGLSVRSIFKYCHGQKYREVDAHMQKLIWSDGSGSDLFAILKVYKVWSSLRQQHNMTEDRGEYAWAERYFIDIRAIKEMHLLVTEIKERLLQYGIREFGSTIKVHWIDLEKTIILKIIIAGAFYPNYFTRSSLNDPTHERYMYQTIYGHDPCNTIYFKNFHSRYIAQLYTSRIKEIFRGLRIHPKNIDVHFQENSERLFVTFKNHMDDDMEEVSKNLLVPGRVRPEIYRALRLRMTHMNLQLNVLEPYEAIRYGERQGVGVYRDGCWIPNKKELKHPELIVLPNVFKKKIRGYIMHIVNCSLFYMQPLSEQGRLHEIRELLNNGQLIKFSSPQQIVRGMMVAAPIKNILYRARVAKVVPASRALIQFKVHFIDYGNFAVIDYNKLFRLAGMCETLIDLPPRIFPCRMAGIEPSSVKSPNGIWCEDSIELLKELSSSGLITEIEIYSVVQGISNVIINTSNSTLNDILVENGLARKSDENYMSKTDHDFRLRKQANSYRFHNENHRKQNEEYLRSIQPTLYLEVEPPPKESCEKTITLRGPISPLETNVYSVIRVGNWKTVTIERESVNAVLLDTDPQDVYERSIVAAGITEELNGQKLTARGTTLMPNINGFTALMTLLFCPTMQLKTNKNKTKYVSIIAGLGYDENTYQPLFEEHDVILRLDTDILKEDLKVINQLRYCMDTLLFTLPGDDKQHATMRDRTDLQAKIQNLIIRLLSKNRAFIETHIDAKDNIWEQFKLDDMYLVESLYNKRSIFPMHSTLRLYDEKFDRMHALCVHCQELYNYRQFEGNIQPITCQLCNQILNNVVELRIHLLSQLHCDREKQIRFKLQKN